MLSHTDRFIELLEASLKKNGDKPITISHLLAMYKKMQRDAEREEFDSDLDGCRHEIH